MNCLSKAHLTAALLMLLTIPLSCLAFLAPGIAADSPTVTSITPDEGCQYETLPEVILTGTGFSDETGVVLRRGITAVAAGAGHTVGLMQDGTVVAAGDGSSGQCEVAGWARIAAVTAGASHTVGLKGNGTVIAVGNNGSGQCEVGGWTNITAVAAGTGHTVGLMADGTVVAVGDNSGNQCDVSKWTNVTAVAAGAGHTVGLMQDGTVIAVGENYSGQCNVSTWKNVTAVAAGQAYTIGLVEGGGAIAVGDNTSGQCGVAGWAGITAIAAGAKHTVGLMADGTVVAVGDNSRDQCEVGGWAGITTVAAGKFHTVGLRADDTVAAVGDNTYGQRDVAGFTESIDATNVALKDSNNLICEFIFTGEKTGYWDVLVINPGGQFGILPAGFLLEYHAPVVSSITPGGEDNGGAVHISDLVGQYFRTGATVKLVLAGQADIPASGVTVVSPERITCDFDLSGAAAGTWDVVVANNDGKYASLEKAFRVRYPVPGVSSITPSTGTNNGVVNVTGLVGTGFRAGAVVKLRKPLTAVSTGYYHTVAVKWDGTVTAAGDNGVGQCNISGWTNITAVAAGGMHTVGLEADGTAVAVGDSNYGKCDVSGWTGITAVAAGQAHTVGLRADGTVVAVGMNNANQCNVTGWTGITAVSAGNFRTIGLRADGTVISTAAWPDLSGWTNITAVAAGTSHTVGLRADGTVVAVGNNTYGQLDVTGWTGITAIAAAGEHTVGIGADGTVKAVGRNDYGQCDVSGWEGIAAISAGSLQTVALRADGTVVAVGDNTYGQLNITGWVDINASSVSVVDPATITCIFNLAGVQTGLWDVIVINDDGRFGVLPGGFNVTYPAPDVTLIMPNNGTNNGICDVAMQGHYFRNGITARLVRSGQPDISDSDVYVYSPQVIVCNFDLTGAVVGTWDIVVVNDDGKSGSLAGCFTVSYPAPVIDSITPDAGVNDGKVHITGLSGQYFREGATVKLTLAGQPDILASDTVVASAGSITCDFDLSGAAVALWDVVVVNDDGKSANLAQGFSVQYPSPSVATITPNSGFVDEVVDISDLAGASFFDGAAVGLRNPVIAVSAAYSTAAIRRDGSAAAVGDDYYGQCGVSGWTNLSSIAAGDTHTVGLRENGTVLAAGNNSSGQCDVSGWTDITAIAAGGAHTVGLREDGTVIAVGDNTYSQCAVSGWTGITAIAAGSGHTVGLRADGTVVVTAGGPGIPGYDFTAIAAGASYTVGLQAVGTVVANGQNYYGQCDVTGWTGITAIAAGESHTIGLQADGTVVATGESFSGQCDVGSWTGITAIAAGYLHTVGLRADGTMVAAGTNSDGRCDVSALAGEIAATGVAVLSSSHISCSVDLTDAAMGTWDVVVTNEGGNYGILSGCFTVTEHPAPTLSSITPDSGMTGGGVNVSDLAGAGFRAGAAVMLRKPLAAVAAGGSHTVGLREDGTVSAVGYNGYGQCDVSGWTNVTAVAAGTNHTVGLQADGTALATGDDYYGQCDVSGWASVTAVSAGGSHTVGLREDGTVAASGNNSDGQCDLAAWTDIIAVSAGSNHTVGLRADGTLVAAGNNDYGQRDVTAWAGITAISAGSNHTVGLRADGTVVAAGNNYDGQCDVACMTGITAIAAGGYHTAGMLADGTVVAVGYNNSGQCGVAYWTGVTAIAAGEYHTAGLLTDGTAVAVGSDNSGQCGLSGFVPVINAHAVEVQASSRIACGIYLDGAATGDWDVVVTNTDGKSGILPDGFTVMGRPGPGVTAMTPETSLPQINVNDAVITGTDFTAGPVAMLRKPAAAVSAGDNYTVCLLEDGTVKAVGYNGSGQCDVSGWTGITAVAAGSSHTAGLQADGTVLTAGDNNYGQCDISGWADVTAVAAGDNHTVGLRSDGTAVAVGNNSYGQCDLSGWTDIIAVSAGSYHTVGLKADGTVVAAGDTGYGQCAVTSWTDITAVAAGDNHTVGLRSDGTAVAAGNNYDGQCDVGYWTGVTAVTAGEYHTAGLLADGTVVAVGDNYFGQRDVTGWAGITAMAAGDNHIVGLKADGTVVAVGYDYDGQCNVSGLTAQVIATNVAMHGDYLTCDFDQEAAPLGPWDVIVVNEDGNYGTLADGFMVTEPPGPGPASVSPSLAYKGSVVMATVSGTELQSYSDVFLRKPLTAVSAGESLIIGLRRDGTVVLLGAYMQEYDVSTWRHIAAVDVGYDYVVGLRDDGTVAAVGNNYYGQCDVTGWTGITAVSAGSYHTVGLRADGTVVAAGDTGYGQCDVTGWTGITAVSAGNSHTVGLKADGTVVAAGYDGDGQCDVTSWTDIVAVSAGSNHTVGLKTDGTVVAVGLNNNGQCDVEYWRNITAISAGNSHTVGLQGNGGVLAVGDNYGYRRCDVSGWEGITAVTAGGYCTIGLKADGTPILAGYIGSYQDDISDLVMELDATNEQFRYPETIECRLDLSYESSSAAIGPWDVVVVSQDGRSGILPDGFTVLYVGPNVNNIIPDYGYTGCGNVDMTIEGEEFLGGASVTLRKPVIAVSAGRYHTIGLREDGTVIAVGDNTYGQCDVTAWTGITAVAAGDMHTLGLRNDGTVLAVGDNTYGQCDVTAWTGITAVAAGGKHSVGLTADNVVVAVGDNSHGQYDFMGGHAGDYYAAAIAAGGDNTLCMSWSGEVSAFGDDTYHQRELYGWNNGMISMAAGGNHNVGVKEDGTVLAVGDNTYGQCDVTAWTGATSVTAGYRHTVGLMADGTVLAAGDNAHGQCDIGDWRYVTAVSAGEFHTLGLKGDGTVVAAGDQSGQCDVSGWTGITALDAGKHNTVGLKADGTALAVGDISYGKNDLSAWSDLRAVSAGDRHTVGLKQDHTVVAMGDNSSGQCDVSSLGFADAVAAGSSHTVVQSGMTARAVGDNTYGQCNVDYALAELQAIDAGAYHSVGLQRFGTVVAVGDNRYGQCDVYTWVSIEAVAAGEKHTVGLKADGTVVAVGDNTLGQCDVSGWTGITAIAAGYGHTVGLKADGTVVAVGDNTLGQCDVSGWTGITAIAAGYGHTVGLKADGTVVAVGYETPGRCDVSGFSEDIDATEEVVQYSYRMTCDFDFTGAEVGLWDLVVTNDDGQFGVAVDGFSMEYAPPEVYGIIPASGFWNQALNDVAITGIDFRDVEMTVELRNEEEAETIAGEDIRCVSPVLITCDFTIPDGAALGSGWSVYIIHGDDDKSDTLEEAFEVKAFTVDASVFGGHGTVEEATQNVAWEASATIHISPEPGYHIASITDNGALKAIANPYVIDDVATDHVVVVTFALNTYAITASAGEGGDISPSGTVSVNYGADQAFTITPDEGYVIEDVVVDGVSRGAQATVAFTNVTASHTIIASFEEDISPLATWYLAEGSTNWGFDCYISIVNPNSEEVEVELTYMTGSGAVPGPTVTMPPMSQATVFPATTLGAADFSTKVECTDGKAISVDRTMYWTGPTSTVAEAHCATGVTSPDTTWYMPEGSTNWGFECFVLIQNPGDDPTGATVTWMIEGAAPQTTNVTIGASSRTTLNMADYIGAADASIKVESESAVICERAMYRNDRREGHDSGGTPTAAADYYLAEGCTGFGFTTYVLVQNPNPTATDVEVTYQAATGRVDGPTFTMPANSRKTICVNDTTEIPGPDPSFSTHVHGDQPIIAERAMYWNGGDDSGQVCHDSIGLSAPHTTWYLADGQTSEGRETFTLVSNPNDIPVEVRISYLPEGGGDTVTFTDIINPASRKTYNMADRLPSGRAAVLVESIMGGPVMCERAMYWNNRGTGTDTIGGYSD